MTTDPQQPNGNGTWDEGLMTVLEGAVELLAQRRIGVRESPHNIRVRDYWHLTECLVAMWPEHPDEDCTCWDDSPEWTI